MDTAIIEFEQDCQRHLDRFFLQWPNQVMQKRANRALRLLRATEKPLKGKTEGWAAGLVYFVTTDGRFPCGVPGVLNAEFEKFMSVNMNTARKRAAQIREIVLFDN
ncbi:MAG: hypothetical protein FWD53_02325 [Phycisphaerales bacterium]|nr:hypothetical protein [Phycisphaerales bacterium]